MSDDERIFQGRATAMFAGIPVSDLRRSLDWYNRLFGCEPSFFPNDREAVWAIGELRWIYVIVEPERAGGAIQTIMVDGLEDLIARIAERGLHFAAEENPAPGVRKVMYHDPDGNEIGLGRIPAG